MLIPEEFQYDIQQFSDAMKRYQQGDFQALNDAAASLEEIFHHSSFETSPDNFRMAILNNAGGVFLQRFWARGEQNDLDRALDLWQQAVATTPPDSPEKVKYLTNLGTGLRARYARTGELSDLEESIKINRQAVEATPPNSVDRAASLNSLGNGLIARYARSGEPTDLKEAIESYQQAIVATPPGSPDMAARMTNLGLGLRARYKSTGELVDLQDAIKNFQQAMTAVSPGSPDKVMIMTNLGIGLNARYERTGDLADLQEALNLFRQVVEVSPPGSPDYAKYLVNLGNSLRDRYEHTGEPADIDEAHSAFRQALATAHLSSSDQAKYLTSLGAGLQARYERTGEPADLEEAIESYRRAVTITPPRSPELAGRLNNLGAGLRARYARTGELTDLEEAIESYRQAVASTSPGSPELASRETNLGNSLSARYTRSGKLDDLQEALNVFRQAMAAALPGSPDQVIILNNLGAGFRARYERTGELADLEEALSAFRQALIITPYGSPALAGCLNNMGIGLSARYLRMGELTDLEEAIKNYQQAVASTPHGSPELAGRLNNLGAGLSARYERTGEPDNLEKALCAFRQAVTFTSPDSPELAGRLSNLGNSLRDHYTRTGEMTDLHEAIDSYRQAVRLGQGVAWEAGLAAARSWGNWASVRNDWLEAVEAFQAGLRLAEQIDRIQLSRPNRELMLKTVQGLSSQGAYALAHTKQTKQAVQVLENGRARLLREALERSRKDLEGLPEMGNAGLYERYREANQLWEALSNPTHQEANQDPLSVEQTSLERGTRLKSIQTAIDALVEEIRMVPGYEGFLHSLSLDEIQAVSATYPLVYLLAANQGGLALLVEPENITPIWLPELSESALYAQVHGVANDLDISGYLGRYTAWRRVVSDQNALDEEKNAATIAWSSELEAITKWMWDAFMGEVVQTLSAREIYQAVVIPSGWLGLLPLHAAWRNDPAAPTGRHYVIDDIQITYSPSAHALKTAQRWGLRPAESILIVGNPDGSIPFAEEATAAAMFHFEPPHINRLEKNGAVPDLVKAAMQQAAVLQFYTHGITGFRDPLDQSFLLLAGGKHLSLREILDLKLEKARLAFLAACETGVPGTALLDEVVSLPAGFLQAGVPGVIGSHWIVADISTMLLMARFYDLWKGIEGNLSPSAALQQSQIWLRNLTNKEIQAYLKSSLSKANSPVMPENAARAALDHLLLEDSEIRLFAHPYHWAAFSYTGC